MGGDAAEVRARFRAEFSDGWSTGAAVVWQDPVSDLALLQLQGLDSAPVIGAQFGRLPESTRQVEAHVVGSPRAKLWRNAAGAQIREPHHAVGSISGLSNLKLRSLEIAVVVPTEDPPPEVSPQEATSGAAV